MTAAEYSNMSIDEATRHSMEAHERLAECDDLQMFGDEHIVIVVYPGFGVPPGSRTGLVWCDHAACVAS
jgi:hypothetical protein